MRYKCTVKWRDMTDGHLYNPGEFFPYDDREIPAGRIGSLSSGKNRAGIALIVPVGKDGGGGSVKAEETQKRIRGRRKPS